MLNSFGFDAPFQRRLLEVLANRSQVEGGNNEAEAAGTTFRRPARSEKLHEFIIAYNHKALKWFGDFLGINLAGDFSWKRRKLTYDEALERFLHERSRRTKSVWPRLLLAAYLLISSYLLINVYFHYILNVNNLKLERMRSLESNALISGRSANRPNSTELELEFKLRASQARQQLARMGSSHPNWSFILQNMIIVFVLVNLYSYMLTPIHYIIKGWPFLGPQAILDAELERRAQAELIVAQLRHYSQFGRLFLASRLEQVGEHLAAVVGAKPSWLATADGLLVRTCENLERCHRISVRRLKLLALSGRLLPLNRSPDEVHRLALIMLYSITICVIYAQTMIFGIRFVLVRFHETRGIKFELVTVQDYFHEFSTLFMLQFTAISLAPHATILLVTLYDLTQVAKSLKLLIADTIRRNELRFVHLTAGSDERRGKPPVRPAATKAGPSDNLADQISFREAIERDLLVVLIECRMLAKSIEAAKGSLTWLVSMAVWFAAVTLVVSRFHNPYLVPELRPYNVALSCLCLGAALAYLTPVSYLHQHTIKSFEMLWSLAAQMSSFELVPSVAEQLNSSSSIAINSLRRELSDMKSQMRRLACEAICLPLTSQNLTRISLWAVLILISISNNLTLGGEGLSGLANDPLGLFNFLE